MPPIKNLLQMFTFSDIIGEAESDRISVGRDEDTAKESNEDKKNQRPPRLDISNSSSTFNSKKPSAVSLCMKIYVLTSIYFETDG